MMGFEPTTTDYPENGVRIDTHLLFYLHTGGELWIVGKFYIITFFSE